MKPIYNLWFAENKILDAVWKLNAVTLSAQVLTIPICLYYFHQFPNFFLITNLVAVPLSSIILLGELLLFVATLLPVLAEQIGWLLHWLIWMMNTFIERIDRLPFSVADNIQISSAGLIFLYIIVTCSSIWALKRNKIALIGAFAGIFVFGLTRFHSKLLWGNQKKLIVYNLPLHQAIDFVDGKNYFFVGDSNVVKDDFLQNFHLKPSRVTHNATYSDSLPGLFCSSPYFMFASKTIAIIDKPLVKTATGRKFNMDIIIISKNPRLSVVDIHNTFTCKQIIFDASNALWRITKWKTECVALNIPFYSIPEKGAFVMNMN
jgi:competence protein ComEC